LGYLRYGRQSRQGAGLPLHGQTGISISVAAFAANDHSDLKVLIRKALVRLLPSFVRE
jgi:hypothetical protein